MMSIPKALALAAAAGIEVGPMRKAGTVSTRAVGNRTVRYDTTTGGAACWYVYDAAGELVTVPRTIYDGTVRQCKIGGYQGEAIEHALKNQA